MMITYGTSDFLCLGGSLVAFFEMLAKYVSFRANRECKIRVLIVATLYSYAYSFPPLLSSLDLDAFSEISTLFFGIGSCIVFFFIWCNIFEDIQAFFNHCLAFVILSFLGTRHSKNLFCFRNEHRTRHPTEIFCIGFTVVIAFVALIFICQSQ